MISHRCKLQSPLQKLLRQFFATQQPSSSSTAPATEGRQAEGGLELTILKRDDEADLDESIADGPEVAALYPVDTELSVKLDESTVTVLSQEVWESPQLYWQNHQKKTWNKFDNKHALRHGAV